MQLSDVARQRVKSLGLTGSYGFDAGPGRLTLRGSANWLDSAQQVIPTQDSVDLSGTLFNPPKVSSRIGVVWNQGGLTASAFANYKGGVTNRIDEVKSASFTTFDRSEEHTSELQSLMRISYAVFCLKKKQSQQKTYNVSAQILIA